MVHSYKKLSIPLIALAALLFCGISRAEDTADLIVGPFGTLNNQDNPLTIPAEKAQDLLNVDITPGGKSFKRRKGFGIAQTLSISTSPVHGTYLFYDANGNDVALYFNDRNMSASISGGAAAVVMSTGNFGVTYQCTDAEGFAYCVNSATTNVVKTNGSVFSLLPVITTGTLITNTPKRLVLSGFNGFPNRIDFSKSVDFTTWTLGGQDTDPIQFTIVAPGAKITHITYAFNRVMWFKNSSFGYILEGQTQADWTTNIVSPNLGTLDNTSVYWNGLLYFRGQDGHLYSYDGSNVVKLTRDVGGTIALSKQNPSNFWTQTLASDFSAGSSSSTMLIANSVVLSTNNVAVVDPSFETSNPFLNWSGSLSFYSLLTTASRTCGTVTAQSGSTYLDYEDIGALKSTNTVTVSVIDSYNTYASTTLAISNLCTWRQQTISGLSGIRRSVVKLKITNNSNSTGFVYSTTFTASGNDITFYFTSGRDGSLYFYDLDNFQGGVTTTAISSGAFVSAVKNAPFLKSWDTFNATTVLSSGTISFKIRTSTNSFTVSSATPAWTALTNGAVISASTGSYFQIGSTFTVTVASYNPTMNDFTVNWFEPIATDKSYAAYFKDAIWWSIPTGEGTATNNTIIRHDLINNGQTIYDIPSNGFYVRNQDLYFGSPTAGYVFKFGDADTDNGSAISAYWKSKDFFSISPFIDNDYRTLSVSAASVADSSATVTYTVNGSSSASFIMPLYSPASDFTHNNRNLPLGRTGTTMNVQIGNNAVDQPLEVFGVKVGYTPKSWKPN